ncbi:MAG: LPS export ABC transporter periplasmic protein LptC [candidate division Zixibacteria bacterium]|nr:LPS export ABC transporter periplasmic protein LptC [candidate division Zixibacteria bacterium]
MKRTITTLLTALVTSGCILVSSGCDSEKSFKPRNSAGDVARRPDSETGGALISLYNGEELTTTIHAERILKFEAQDSAVAYHLKIKFLDSAGRAVTDLVGDSGIVRENKGLFEIFGHVVGISSEQNTRLETDYLKWNPEINRIQTDAFVRITRGEDGGDVITGWGLETDRQFSRVKILREVSGTVSESTVTR